MNSPLLHGAAGNLDELLACGVGLAVILLLVFIVEMRGRNKPAKVNETINDEQGH